MSHKLHAITVLKSLADETRLDVAKFVAASEQPVPSCTVVGSCAQRLKLSQPAMSHHFKKLVDAGVLIQIKQGTENHYRFNHEALERLGIDITKL